MGLTKKTTILFPPDLHHHLCEIAARKGTSLGALVREACKREYGGATTEERLAAVANLAALDLPVDTPEAMARESVPRPDDLMP